MLGSHLHTTERPPRISKKTAHDPRSVEHRVARIVDGKIEKSRDDRAGIGVLSVTSVTVQRRIMRPPRHRFTRRVSWRTEIPKALIAQLPTVGDAPAIRRRSGMRKRGRGFDIDVALGGCH